MLYMYSDADWLLTLKKAAHITLIAEFNSPGSTQRYSEEL